MTTSASIMFISLLASSPTAPDAWPDQVIVHQASALVKPCRESAEAYFREQDITTYQWSASHKSQANDFLVSGRLRLEGGEEVRVDCWLRRGERVGKMKMEIGRID